MPSQNLPSQNSEGPANWRHFWLALIVALISLVVIDRTFGWVMDQLYEKSSKNPIAQIERTKPEWLVVGSSVAKYAVDPSFMDIKQVYNAGRNGQGIYYATLILKALPENTSVKRVIWFVDPGDLVMTLKDGGAENIRAVSPLVTRVPSLRKAFTGDDVLKSIALYSHLYRYRELAPGIAARWLRPHWQETGYSPPAFVDPPKPQSNDPITEDAEKKPKASSRKTVLQPSTDGQDILRILADEIKKRDWQLVLVTGPVLNDDRTTKEAFRDIYALLRKTMRGLSVCDLTTLPASGFANVIGQSDYFFDGAHMNGPGAKAMSRQLSVLLRQHCLGAVTSEKPTH